MEGLEISIPEVQQAASTIENLNKNLSMNLDEIKQIMNSTQDVYRSADATTIRAKFEMFSKKYFEDYKDVIDKYVAFLRNAVAEGYSSTQAKENSSANQFM